MPTNPATTPIQSLIADGFSPLIATKTIYGRPAEAAAVLIVAKADTSKAFAHRAEPALKSNQPKHLYPLIHKEYQPEKFLNFLYVQSSYLITDIPANAAQPAKM